MRWFGAVQSQDPVGAKWALGQRARGATEAEIDRLIDDGAILRTHVMRPTWHFVLPEDIRWLLDLTSTRVIRGLAGRYRQLAIEERDVARVAGVLESALSGGRHLTRSEIGEALRRSRIAPDGQRLPHFLMRAELDGLIVSGPRRGNDHTYALLEERAPRARTLERADAIAELARRYFRSHGPAAVPDFAWWSGLTIADARAGIALAVATLEREVIAGVDHWSDDAGTIPGSTDVAHLLPNFDEYTVGYHHRADLIDPRRPFDPSIFAFGSILANVVTVGGRVRGAWRRTIGPGRALRVEIRLFGRPTRPQKDAIERAAVRMAPFSDRSLVLEWAST